MRGLDLRRRMAVGLPFLGKGLVHVAIKLAGRVIADIQKAVVGVNLTGQAQRGHGQRHRHDATQGQAQTTIPETSLQRIAGHALGAVLDRQAAVQMATDHAAMGQLAVGHANGADHCAFPPSLPRRGLFMAVITTGFIVYFKKKTCSPIVFNNIIIQYLI